MTNASSRVILLACTLITWSTAVAAQQLDEQTTGVGRLMTRAEFLQPRPQHPLFRPRGSELPASPGGFELPIELPRLFPQQREEGDQDHLRRQWAQRRDAEEFQRVIEQALAIEGDERDEVMTHSSIWRPIGMGISDPDSKHNKAGRLSSAAYAFDDTQHAVVLFLGATGGGLWKYNLSLASFVNVSDTLPGSPAVGAFVVDPSNSDRMLIASGDYNRYGGSGVYRTTDGGKSWVLTKLSSPPAAFQKMLVDLADSNTVLVSGDTGIWRSTDFGAKWTKVYTGATSDLLQDPTYTWAWYAGAPGIGLLGSKDSGHSFQPLNGNGGDGIPDPVGLVTIALCESASNYVYCLIENNAGLLNGIYRSAANGLDRWVPIDTVDTISWGQAFHTGAIAVDPDDPNRVFVGMGGIQFTENATAASPCWRRNVGTSCSGCCLSTDVDGGHADFTSFVFIPDSLFDDTRVILTNDGGYYVYDYRGRWFYGGGNLLGLQIAQTMQFFGALSTTRANKDVMLAGLQDNGIVSIDTSAAEVMKYLGGGDGGQTHISPFDATMFFSSSGVAYSRYYSTNAGGLWNWVNCSFPNDWAPTVMHDPWATGLMYTHSGEYAWIKWSIDTNCDWTQVNGGHPLPSGFNSKQIDVANTNDFVFYVTAWNSDKLYVMDSDYHGLPGYMNWADRTPPLPSGSSRIDCGAFADRSPAQPDTVYYTTGSARPSRAFRSVDRGKNWVDVTGDLKAKLPGANYWELVGNPNNLSELYLATDVGVFRSVNGGFNWTRYMAGLPAVISAHGIEYVENGTSPSLRIGSYGRGWWQRTISPCAVTSGEFGNGLAGSGGYVPYLTATDGYCTTGGYFIDIGDGLGGASGRLWVGTKTTETFPFYGGYFYIDLTGPWTVINVRLLGTRGTPGAGYLSVPGVDVNLYAGLTLYLQADFIDPGAPQGRSITNALRLVIE